MTKQLRAVIFALCMTLLVTAVIVIAVYILPANFIIDLRGDTVRYIDLAYGFSAELPVNMSYDYSLYENRICCNDDTVSFTVSRENAGGYEVHEYVAYYLDRFFDSEEYRAANGITLISRDRCDGYDLTVISLGDAPDGAYTTYAYVTVYTSGSRFYRTLIRSYGYTDEVADIIDRYVSSFFTFGSLGRVKNSFTTKHSYPSHLDDATKSTYETLYSGQHFGIYAEDIENTGINYTVPDIELKCGYDFPVVLDYVHLNSAFPADFMQRMYSRGKTVELTYQLTDSNNSELFGKSTLLDVYCGNRDDDIRAFARAAAEFGHPFIFRLCNEMNSDWTSYSGVVNLCDPDIYVSVWRRIYEIFTEENVTNAIWVFNPNDVDYPPCCWNTYLAYYPGDEYVDIIGLTGYNTGTYYSEVTGERWRGFDEIYGNLCSEYARYFTDFPWMITEFGCSSYGGDKAAWIDDMFDRIASYDNIHIAVWFCACDYDTSQGGRVPARDYRLTTDNDVTTAFKNGIEKFK